MHNLFFEGRAILACAKYLLLLCQFCRVSGILCRGRHNLLHLYFAAWRLFNFTSHLSKFSCKPAASSCMNLTPSSKALWAQGRWKDLGYEHNVRKSLSRLYSHVIQFLNVNHQENHSLTRQKGHGCCFRSRMTPNAFKHLFSYEFQWAEKKAPFGRAVQYRNPIQRRLESSGVWCQRKEKLRLNNRVKQKQIHLDSELDVYIIQLKSFGESEKLDLSQMAQREAFLPKVEAISPTKHFCSAVCRNNARHEQNQVYRMPLSVWKILSFCSDESEAGCPMPQANRSSSYVLRTILHSERLRSTWHHAFPSWVFAVMQACYHSDRKHQELNFDWHIWIRRSFGILVDSTASDAIECPLSVFCLRMLSQK